MPDLGNPGVSVFHFTSRISNAKIKKYKQATERGMSTGIKDIPGIPENIKFARELSSNPKEPLAKRQKTKSHSICSEVTTPSASSEAPATSRPKRESTLKFRYSDNMVISATDHANAAQTSTSGLSSPTSTPQVEPIPIAEREPTPCTIDEDYGMLSTYYIMDDDVDEDNDDGNRKTSEPSIARASTPLSSQPSALQPLGQPAKPPRSLRPPQTKQRQQPTKVQKVRRQLRLPSSPRLDYASQPKIPPPQVAPHHPFPQPPIPPMIPRVILMDMEPEFDPKKRYESVSPKQTIKSIDALSFALSNFSGVPFVPGASNVSSASNRKTAEPKESRDSVRDDDQVDNVPDPSLSHPGGPDANLMYGIQFIQNALKSWAHQRMQNVLAEHTMKQWHALQAQQTQRRGPGRPRKFNPEAQQQELNAAVHMSLANQPEGRAILAFHEVLQCGALQVNGILSLDMARALKHLYMQIDYLINKGPRADPPFVCMSYGAQQAAHRNRLLQAIEDVAKMEEELELHQKTGLQDTTQQIGSIVPRHTSWIQRQQNIASHPELRQDPYLHGSQASRMGQSSSNPIVLGSQASDTSGMAPSSPLPDMRLRDTPAALYDNVSNYQNSPLQGEPVLPVAAQAKGQQMRFSFSSGNAQASSISGQQAFTDGAHPASGLPNRGPTDPGCVQSVMNVPELTALSREPITIATDSAGSAVSPSQGTTIERTSDGRNRKAHAAISPVAMPAEGKLAANDSKVAVASPPRNAGFTAINAPSRHPIPDQVMSSTAHSDNNVPESQSSARTCGVYQMGSVTDLASRYPYPGALVVDR
nr:hypothetical protein CFP56_09219 [Quercus suber]